jgi:putative selenium metabolism hydrolase
VSAEWDAVSLAQALIQIESLSGQEGGVAALVESAMRALGFREVERDVLGNVIGFAGPHQPGTALLFDAHMDVVPAMGSWSVPPFAGVVLDGRLYGRGAADMKGALAAAIVGVGEAARSGLLQSQVAVSASVLEETVEGVALSAVIERTSPEMVVICEPSSLGIRHGQRGRIEILIEVAGIPAHAAYPERGRNPLLLAARAIEVIEKMQLPSDPYLGAAIMVPTDIVTAPYPSISSIPPLLTVRYDRRTVWQEDSSRILSDLRAVLAAIDPAAFTLKVSNAPVYTYTGRTLEAERNLPAWLVGTESSLARAAADSLVQIGRAVDFGVYSFCTNGSESAGRRGIQTIGFGPGAEEDAHTADESVSVQELRQAAAAYRGLCVRIAGGTT